MLELRVLHFEDLSVGMSETFAMFAWGYAGSAPGHSYIPMDFFEPGYDVRSPLSRHQLLLWRMEDAGWGMENAAPSPDCRTSRRLSRPRTESPAALQS